MAIECLQYEYPKIMAGLSAKQDVTPTICLVVQTEYDKEKENEAEFKVFLNKLKPYYQQLYIIQEAEARKCNLLFGITRLYLNKEMVVNHMEFGNCNAANLNKEVSQNSL